jgi:hypothetical protein
MKRTTKLVILATLVVCVVAPAIGLAAGPPSTPGAPNATGQQSGQPGPGAPLPAKAMAYGRYCQNQSKKHVAGQKGTPFSQCVTAMAKLATGKTNSPKTACAPMSKKHVAGEKGTPYSRCVAAGAKLLKDQNQPNP